MCNLYEQSHPLEEKGQGTDESEKQDSSNQPLIVVVVIVAVSLGHVQAISNINKVSNNVLAVAQMPFLLQSNILIEFDS